jgi:hypothetical protein
MATEIETYFQDMEENGEIAVFMGYILNEERSTPQVKLFSKSGSGLIEDHRFEYRTNWNRLIPVVEKIESIYNEKHGYFGVHIRSNACCIQGTKFRPGEVDAYYDDVTHESKIKATFYAVLQFVRWYNQNIKDGN